MASYPTAYRAGAAKYASPAPGFQGLAGLPMPVPPVPKVPGDLDYLPKAGLDYIPESWKQPAQPAAKQPSAGFHDYLSRQPTMSGGTAFNAALRYGLRGLGPLGAVASNIDVLFSGARLLNYAGAYLSTVSNTKHCGPVMPNATHQSTYGFTRGPFYRDFATWGVLAGAVQTLTPTGDRTSYEAPAGQQNLHTVMFLRATKAPYAAANYMFLMAHWANTVPYGTGPVPKTITHDGTNLIDWVNDPIFQPVAAVREALPEPQPATDSGNGGKGPWGSAGDGVLPVDLPTKPGPRTRERKPKSGGGAALTLTSRFAKRAMHYVTETGDVVDAIYDAIPEDKQIPVNRKGADGTWVKPSLSDKVRHIYENMDNVDWDMAWANVVVNNMVDSVIGKTSNQTMSNLKNAGWKFGAGVGTGPAL